MGKPRTIYSYTPPILALAHYKFENYAEDTDGGHHGTYTDVSFNVAKILNGAIFSLPTARIDCNSEFVGTVPLTICAWFYMNGWGAIDYGRILENGKLDIYVKKLTKNVRFTSKELATTAESSTDSIGLLRWIHLIVSRNAAGIANIYLNNSLCGGPNQNSGAPTTGTHNVHIGNRLDLARNFDGIIDDLRVYDRILTAKQRAFIYNGGEGTQERIT